MLTINKHKVKLVLALYFYHNFDNIHKGYDKPEFGKENYYYSYISILQLRFEK